MIAALWIVGGLAYIAIGGAVREIASRIEIIDGGEDAIGLLWPLFFVLVPVAVVVWSSMRFGAWCGACVVEGVEALVEWRRRPRLPRATVRKGGR